MLLESAFIEAIHETPDDRTLRLVYADWLDETGDRRGELIRMQCELDELPVGNPQRTVLRQAIHDVCSEHQSEWLAPLRRRVLGWQKARFEFGLVDNVTMSPTAFLKHAEAGLFEEMPHLVGICLEGAETPMLKALSSPYLAKLTSLTLRIISPPNTGSLIDCLASLKTTRNLASLNLADCRCGDTNIAVLLRSPNFPKLQRLNLQNNSLTPWISQVLLHSPFLGQLKMLALGSRWHWGHNRLEDLGVRALTETSQPLELRWLDLVANNLSDSSGWDLVQSTAFPKLECLHLWGNDFGPASRTALEARFSNRVFFSPCEPDCDCTQSDDFSF